MKQKIYNLLMVNYRGLLESCYRQVFFTDSTEPAVKTFDDYLSDFYLYLYDAKPKHVQVDVKGYYIQQIRDEKAIPGWLRTTFKHFLLEENKIMREMQETLAEYRQQISTSLNSHPIDLTLMHVGFAIAWFNQHETSEDKYLFFRNAYKHYKGFYSWPDDELDDKEVAKILSIEYGTLRTRTSRLWMKVKKLVNELNDAYIATLNKRSLEIAKEIYETDNPDIESILETLLGEAEKELPQYENIVKLRKEKRISKDGIFGNLQYISVFESIKRISRKNLSHECGITKEITFEEMECECSETITPKPSNRIVKIFMNLIEGNEI